MRQLECSEDVSPLSNECGGMNVWILTPSLTDKHIRLRKREPSNLSILTQVVLAMLFLSSRNIMHRDLKPLNILVRVCE